MLVVHYPINDWYISTDAILYETKDDKPLHSLELFWNKVLADIPAGRDYFEHFSVTSSFINSYNDPTAKFVFTLDAQDHYVWHSIVVWSIYFERWKIPNIENDIQLSNVFAVYNE